MKPEGKNFLLIKVIAISVVVALVSPFLGRNLINPFVGGNQWHIFYNIRVPIMLFSFFVGAGMSVTGLAVQKIFSNPIATGHTLGVSSAGSFGAAFFIVISAIFPFLPAWLMPLSSIVFSLIAILLISFLYSKLKEPVYVILCGISIGFFFSSLITFSQLATTLVSSRSVLMYLTGSLSVVSYRLPFFAAGISLVLLFLFLHKSLQLNAISTGRMFAISRGFDYDKTFLLFLVVCGLAVALFSAMAGPISFVDLFIPHIAFKMGFKSLKDRLVASFFIGGAFMCVCSVISRSVFEHSQLPPGIITGVIGSIFLFYIVFARKKNIA